MKLSLLNLKTKSFLRRNKAVRANLPYKQALNVGIIFSVEDKTKHDEIKDFVKRLEHDGKRVKVMSYLPKHKDNYEFMFDFFTDKDLSFWGNFVSNTVNDFAESAFDILYYPDTTPNPFVLNLIARSKARFRVGKFWENNEKYFELMIESKQGTRSLIDEMYKYTRALK